MACDICGKVGTGLVDLLSLYKTDGVAQVCPDCEKKLNAQLIKIKLITCDITRWGLKSFINNLRSSFRSRGGFWHDDRQNDRQK